MRIKKCLILVAAIAFMASPITAFADETITGYEMGGVTFTPEEWNEFQVKLNGASTKEETLKVMEEYGINTDDLNSVTEDSKEAPNQDASTSEASEEPTVEKNDSVSEKTEENDSINIEETDSNEDDKEVIDEEETEEPHERVVIDYKYDYTQLYIFIGVVAVIITAIIVTGVIILKKKRN